MARGTARHSVGLLPTRRTAMTTRTEPAAQTLPVALRNKPYINELRELLPAVASDGAD